MNKVSSISATKISSFLNNFDVYNISIEDVLSYASVNPLILSSPDNRLSGVEAHKIIESATKLTNNENLGLMQGENLSKGFSNILGYILMNCSTLEECWDKYCRYEKIIDSTGFSDFNIKDNNAIISNITLDDNLKNCRQFADFKIAGTLSYIKLLCNKNLQLNEVHFTYPKPKDISHYKNIFNCKVFFEKPNNALIFDSALLHIPVIEPNKNLLDLFEESAKDTLKKLTNDSYTEMVSQIIYSEIINCSLPSIEIVAKKLLLSVRSLQLYLQKENTTFNTLIKEIRKSTAEKYLNNSTISIDEVAYILGFSETSAFYRAFKSWTGLTPKEFKNSFGIKP
ncbi:MAG: AraC family transcriptional regulator ligand-binding domain-containing protein [Clostridiaceae bacterium]